MSETDAARPLSRPEKLAHFVAEYRVILVVTGVLLALLAAPGLWQPEIITDHRIFFEQDDPALTSLATIEEEFGAIDSIIFAVAPTDGSVMSRASMRLLEDVGDGLLQMPARERTDSVATTPIILDESSAARPTVTSMEVLMHGDNEPRLQAARSVLAESALVKGTLLADNLNMGATIARVQYAGLSRYQDTAATLDHARQVRDELQERAGDRADILFSGTLPFSHGIVEQALNDLRVMLPISLIASILLMLALMRSLRGVLACTITIVLTLITAAGLAGWMGMQVSMPNMFAPIIILIITLAYTIHLADHYLTEFRRADGDRKARIAVRHAVALNMRPILITAGTTIVGFLSLNLSVSPPYRDLGNMVAMGVAVAVIYCLFVLPGLIAILRPQGHAADGWWRPALTRYANWASRPWAGWQSALVCIFLLAITALIPLNTVDDNISHWFMPGSELREDTDRIDRELTGMQQLYFRLESARDEGALEPVYLNEVQQFAQWLRQQPGVTAVRALPDLLDEVAPAFIKGAQSRPQDFEALTRLMFDYEAIMPERDRAGGLLNDEYSASLIHVAMRAQSGQGLLDLNNRALDWLQNNTTAVLAPASGVSAEMLFVRNAISNIDNSFFSTLLVTLAAGLLFAVIFQSKRYALLSLVPNLLPVALAFGVWSLISGHIGIAVSVIAAAAIGIIVDDTVHLLYRYRQGRHRLALDASGAVRYALESVGGALTITTATLVVGFGLISTSSLLPNHEIGLWMALAIFIAWLFDMLVLPQFLMRFDK